MAGSEKGPGVTARRLAVLQLMQGCPRCRLAGQAQRLGQGPFMRRGKIFQRAAVGGARRPLLEQALQLRQRQGLQSLLAARLVRGCVGDDQMLVFRHGSIVGDATMRFAVQWFMALYGR